MPKLEIDLDHVGHGDIRLDGESLKHARALTLHFEAGEVTRAEVELVGVDVLAHLEDAEVMIERVTYEPAARRAARET